MEKIIHEEHKLPLGLDFEDVELVSLDLTSSSIVTAIKPTEMEKMNDVIMSSLSVYSKNQFVILVDAEDNMSQYSEDVTSYYSAPSDLSNIRLGFKQEIEARKNGEKSIEECKIVFINNIKRFNQLTGMTEDEIRVLFNEGQKVNIIIIASGLYSDTIGAFDRESKMMVRTINQALISHKISEQEFIRVKDRFGEPELKVGEMYYINNQEYQKIKLMEG